jgi:hypothetical protein
MDYDTWLEEPEQEAWTRFYLAEQEAQRQQHDVQVWIETESAKVIWRVWDEVADGGDDWLKLYELITVALFDSQDAKQVAQEFMLPYLVERYDLWANRLHKINKERGWK